MKKIIAKVMSLISVTAVLAVYLPIISASADANIGIGEYLQMGTYYGEPILWRCVDIDDNGPLMISDRILCLKSFDANAGTNGNSVIGSHSRNEYRKTNESNYWGDSNIRSWLNSDEDAGDVEWLCGNPPTKDNVWDNKNAYDREAGFLSNFKRYEITAMKDVSQKLLLAQPEVSANMYTTGTELHECFLSDLSMTLTNYDTAFAEYVTDKMFLIDIKQAVAIYNNKAVLGENYQIAKPTKACVDNSEYKEEFLSADKEWSYWLRSPNANVSNRPQNIDTVGELRADTDGYNSTYGIRPAFYLNEAKSSFASGSGSALSPYILENITYLDFTEKYSGLTAWAKIAENTLTVSISGEDFDADNTMVLAAQFQNDELLSVKVLEKNEDGTFTGGLDSREYILFVWESDKYVPVTIQAELVNE